MRSSVFLAVIDSAGLSFVAIALTCALPQTIFEPSLSRRSSVKRLLWVSTTTRSRSDPSLLTDMARPELYVLAEVGTLNQLGNLA